MHVARSSVVAFALIGLLSIPGRAQAQAVGFAPTVAPLNDGVSLSATPVVSADRRYVRLSLQPTFQAINGFTTFPVPAAVGGGGANRGPGGGFASVPPGDLSMLEDDYMIRRPIPTARSAKAAKARAARGKKPLPDPMIVPIKKTEARKVGGVPRG